MATPIYVHPSIDLKTISSKNVDDIIGYLIIFLKAKGKIQDEKGGLAGYVISFFKLIL